MASVVNCANAVADLNTMADFTRTGFAFISQVLWDAMTTMATITSKELVATYFTDLGDNKWQCHCGKKRAKGRGRQNLIDHIHREHSDTMEEAKSSNHSAVTSFFRKKDSNIFNWIKCIVEDILPFRFCEKENVQLFSKLEPISVETFQEYMGKLTFLVEEKIKTILPNYFHTKVVGLRFPRLYVNHKNLPCFWKMRAQTLSRKPHTFDYGIFHASYVRPLYIRQSINRIPKFRISFSQGAVFQKIK